MADSGYKVGALVMCRGNTANPAHRKFAGTVHTIREPAGVTRFGPHWRLDPPTCLPDGFELNWTERALILLKGPEDEPAETESPIHEPAA